MQPKTTLPGVREKGDENDYSLYPLDRSGLCPVVHRLEPFAG
jgi:hypothetical protein